MTVAADQERPGSDFASPYLHGFARIAVGVPKARVADPMACVEGTLELARRAADSGAVLALFPELCLSSYTAEDLFQQTALHDAVAAGLSRLLEETNELGCALIVGVPLRNGWGLFNCAAILLRGRIVGVVPKSYLPNYREFDEKRQFAAARDSGFDTIEVCGQQVPFGVDLLFPVEHVEHMVVHAEICEDLWVPIPPSSRAALAGATVLVNLSASDALVAKADYRRLLCASQSARCISAYLYAAAGHGESTTDLAWDGQALIYENGEHLAEAEPFSDGEQLLVADIDLERLAADRLRTTSFTDAATDERARGNRWRHLPLDLTLPTEPLRLSRVVERFPFVPSDREERFRRCQEVHRIQVQGLTSRMEASGIERLVVGVSGGLDSAVAAVVAAHAMDRLGLPRSGVLAVNMPGFATSARTRKSAQQLIAGLGLSFLDLDIRPAANQMLADIDHPAARGDDGYDITYENVQAGERTSHLFRLANHRHGLVVGTSDLTELALGWCTYGVGDQMAHYDVNASVPKTLVRALASWMADTPSLGDEARAALLSILSTTISPELVPGDTRASGT